MRRFQISGISGVYTRKLNRVIRSTGSCKALLTDAGTAPEEGLRKLKAFELPRNAVETVSCLTLWDIGAENSKYHVAAIDCGIKRNIIHSLVKRGCHVTVVPWNASPESIFVLHPDGILISNGPGDPTDIPGTIRTVREMIGRCPIFGICLGHQIHSLAYGAETYNEIRAQRGKPSCERSADRKD